MHLHSKSAPGILLIIVFMAGVLCWPQASQPKQPAGQAGSQTQTIQPTPLPSDVDPGDPALPVWMRPATAATTPNPTKNPNAANPATNTGVSPTGTDNTNQGGRVGQVVKKGDIFTMTSIVENVTLPVV